MSWTVHLSPNAVKQLGRLPQHDNEAVRDGLRGLARDPFSVSNAKRLRNHLFGWRLRVGNYRVLYDIDPIDQVIVVAQVVRRTSKTYRRR